MSYDQSARSLGGIGSFLERRARQSEPIFYNDLARTFGLPPVTEAWFSHPFCEIFGSLDNQDQSKDRPFRTAIVVSKDRNIPGEGFFKTLHELRGTPYPVRDELAKFKIWKEEFDRLVSFYK